MIQFLKSDIVKQILGTWYNLLNWSKLDGFTPQNWTPKLFIGLLFQWKMTFCTKAKDHSSHDSALLLTLKYYDEQA